ncbi:hypothetical protein V6R21_07195 [Limibacter armeniacum]|uniref:hypothetical protein n=1 Tax=Limibacter armeniacum TaxID=466084 RepID=UPI002FE5AF0A
MSSGKTNYKWMMKAALKQDAQLSFDEMLEIVRGCKSVFNSYEGIGKIKGMIAFLDEGNAMTVVRGEQAYFIDDKYQLARLIITIDPYLDIVSDPSFDGLY